MEMSNGPQPMIPQPVLVTGASGFLGGYVARRLVSLGVKVRATGRNEKVLAELAKLGIATYRCDLADASSAMAVAKECRSIVHCAALSSPWGSSLDFHLANVQSTKNIVSAAVTYEVDKFVHISSPSIYLSNRLEKSNYLQISETAELPPTAINRYARSKRIAEAIVDQAVENGLAAITLRPQAIFGPGDPSLVPRLILAAGKTGIPLIDGGTHVIDVTYVENVVDAVLCALSSEPACIGQKYNITNGEPIIFRSFIEDVFLRLGVAPNFRKLNRLSAIAIASLAESVHQVFSRQREPILTRYTVSVLSQGRTLNINNARSGLGYTPRISVSDGVDYFVSWWLAKNGITG